MSGTTKFYKTLDGDGRRGNTNAMGKHRKTQKTPATPEEIADAHKLVEEVSHATQFSVAKVRVTGKLLNLRTVGDGFRNDIWVGDVLDSADGKTETLVIENPEAVLETLHIGDIIHANRSIFSHGRTYEMFKYNEQTM